jgi:hypothetical protein
MALVMATGALIVLVLVRVVPRDTAVMLVSDRGPVEYAAVLLYLAGAVMYWRANAKGSRRDLRGGLLLVALALAELGLWKRVYETGFGEGASESWYAPIASAAVLLGVLVVTFRFMRDHWKTLLAGVRSGRWDAVFAFVGLVLLGATVVVDPIQANMWDRGPRGIRFVVGVAEETAEFLVPVLFLLGLWSWFRLNRGRVVESRQPVPTAHEDPPE